MSIRSLPLRLASALVAPALVAAAVGAFAFGSANAAECVKGYRTLGNQIIVACKDEGAPAPHKAFAPRSEPFTTGSVSAPRTARTGPKMVHSMDECEPGRYRVMSKTDGETLLPCGR